MRDELAGRYLDLGFSQSPFLGFFIRQIKDRRGMGNRSNHELYLATKPVFAHRRGGFARTCSYAAELPANRR